jgi:hypothetical protein
MRIRSWLALAIAVAISSPALVLAQVCGGDGQTISPVNSVVPPLLILVGQTNGVVDPAGQYVVKVRDTRGQPIIGVTVDLQFSYPSRYANPDEGICIDQPYPGVTFTDDGTSKFAHQTTGPAGNAVFRIIGNSNNNGHCSAGAQYQSLKVAACGVFLGSSTVAIVDQDGGGVTARDESAILSDIFCGQYFARSDFNGDGIVNAADLSVWLTIFFAGKSTQGCDSYVDF